ncbi:hypothetical protein VP01_119g11 [Puccinia sorghi]|uniref:Uncharacterized protein n=1 Tax=Puccinia sorghi TaxID=27349 RepID=A0A0L6VS36_9BASI|nr:hypothetical protein VP01_119g11 [Puccinia sorghi]
MVPLTASLFPWLRPLTANGRSSFQVVEEFHSQRTACHRTYLTRITSKQTTTSGLAALALAIPLTIYYEHQAADGRRLAQMCTGQRQAALLVLDNLFADLRSIWPHLAPDERLRTIQIAQKLATLLSQPDPNHPPPPPLQTLKKIEDCLTFSVQEICHFLNRQDISYREGPPLALHHDLPNSWHPSELSLQFASCFEALAKFYRERGQAFLLLPDGATSGTSTETGRCRAATVMNIGQCQ